jgi:hypothetical protein
MPDDELTQALDLIRERLAGLAAPLPPPPPGPPGIGARVDAARSTIDRIKDNIAYVIGLPATLGGAFGFLNDHSDSKAQLQHQVDMLEVAVADLKAEGDLLGGGTKNFAIDMSGAPGGSLGMVFMTAGLVVLVAVLFWYQARRRR